MAALTPSHLRDDADQADAAMVSASHARGAALLGELHALPDEPDHTLVDALAVRARANAQAERFALTGQAGPNLTAAAIGVVALAILLGGPAVIVACVARLGWL